MKNKKNNAADNLFEPVINSRNLEKIAIKLDEIASIVAEMKAYHIAGKYSYAARRMATTSKIIQGLDDDDKKANAKRDAIVDINEGSNIL